MKAITKDWINFAETDLHTCKKIIDDVLLTNIVAFHAQQTIEKCFKAIIEEKGLKVPKIHNLIHLYARIENYIDFNVNIDELEKTDEIYIESRYPGDIGMLPDGKPSMQQAIALYNFANDIFQKTVKQLSG